jgi:hypothetical protein
MRDDPLFVTRCSDHRFDDRLPTVWEEDSQRRLTQARDFLDRLQGIDRYIAWPGQALACKIGEIKIRELRTFAEQALGPRFDVRQFHGIILENGGIPLDVLAANIERWVAEQGEASR